MESVATQFEKLFKNLDQISDLKMSDGVTKRNKANQNKIASGQNAVGHKYQGVFNEAVGLSDNE